LIVLSPLFCGWFFLLGFWLVFLLFWLFFFLSILITPKQTQAGAAAHYKGEPGDSDADPAEAAGVQHARVGKGFRAVPQVRG
jgi:hypothetical protein